MAVNWGKAAGGAEQAMQALLEERILKEKMALAQRQQQAEEQYRAAQLAEQSAGRGDTNTRFNAELGWNKEKFGAEAPDRESQVRFRNTQSDTATYNLDRAKAEDPKTDAAMAELEANPDTRGLVRFKRAGLPLEATDANDVKGETKFNRRKEEIRTQGDQQVRVANAQGANAAGRTVTIKTVDENGNPVTKVVPIAEALGQEYGAQPTAEVRNRSAASQRSNGVIQAVDELSARINTQGGLLAKMAGGTSKLAAQANYNDDVAEYEALVSGFTPMVARSLGHTGVLTEQDVQSVRKVFPDPGDSKSVRDRKMARLKSLVAQLNGPEAAPTETPAAPGKKFTITKVQ